MKKIVFVLMSFLLLSGGIFAQQSLSETDDIITGVLNRMPADHALDLKDAMQEMERLDDAGLYRLAAQLIPYEETDNSKLQYAVMGYSAYVSAPDKIRQRDKAESAWIRVLQTSKDAQQAAFFMDMLGIMGTNRSVPALAQLLGHNDIALKVKAAQTLASIKTPEAGQALLSALKQDDHPDAQSALIQALGDVKYAPAAGTIQQLLANGSPQLKNISIRALSKIADPASADVLLSKTIVNKKKFENIENTVFYGQYIGQLSENGHMKEAGGLASQFFNGTKKSNSLARTVALETFAFTHRDESLKTLARAAFDKDKSYRETALKLAEPFVSADNILLFTDPKMIKKASPDVMASMVAFWGKHDARQTASMVKNLAKTSRDPEVKHAAIIAMAQLGGSDVANDLFTILQTGDEGDAIAVRSALQLLPGEVVGPVALAQASESSGFRKAAFLNILGDKGVKESFDLVAANLNNEDQAIQDAAIGALPQVAGEKSLGKLFEMLRTSRDDQKSSAVEQAISAALAESANPDEILMSQFKLLTADNQAALGRYIRLIPGADFPAAQKLLLFQKAMELAGSDQEKRYILNGVSQLSTFPALAFAAQYLDVPSLKTQAAFAVLNIGMSDKSFYGTQVHDWLSEAMEAIEGQDAIYLKKSAQKFLDEMPQKEGFVSMFNEKDLTGWKGLVENPIVRSKMSTAELSKAQVKADEAMRNDWKVEDGELVFVGSGYDNITTVKKYRNIEMLVDWKIYDDGQKNGDAGIYLRGTPQVQIWDTSRRKSGAQVGSGGLYNNKKYRSTPLRVADNPLGEWNHFDIRMIGDRVTVYLNGVLVTDNVPLENFWDRNMPLFPEEQIELQAHGSKIGYRNIYIKELPDDRPVALSGEEEQAGFELLFNGKDLDNWTGNKSNYIVEDGMLAVRPKSGSGGNLYTLDEFSDFELRFDFKLTPGANNGIGIRTPLEGDAAYVGMEIQVLDNTAEMYRNLHEYQYHGSVYGVIPAKRGFLKPVGEWNSEQIIAKGDHIQVILNGEKILDGNIRKAGGKGTIDGLKHPGLFNKTGHIGLLGHGSVVFFRNMRIKSL